METATGDESKRNTKIILAFVLASLLVMGGMAALVVDVLTNVPDFKDMHSVVEVPIKLANKEKSTRKVGPRTKDWVPISQISNYALMAVIASEDTSFFSHQGVDFHELKEAIKKDWKEKKWARGASTITQQVIKNVYLSKQKTLWRKFKEFFWARELDKVFSKNEILNFYFNLVEWGPGIYGIRAASAHYFNTSPANLTARQSAFLALLLPSPIKYHSYFEKRELSRWAEKRVNRILEIMLNMGYIEESDYEAAIHERLWSASSGEIEEILNFPDPDPPAGGGEVPVEPMESDDPSLPDENFPANE